MSDASDSKVDREEGTEERGKAQGKVWLRMQVAVKDISRTDPHTPPKKSSDRSEKASGCGRVTLSVHTGGVVLCLPSSSFTRSLSLRQTAALRFQITRSEPQLVFMLHRLHSILGSRFTLEKHQKDLVPLCPNVLLTSAASPGTGHGLVRTEPQHQSAQTS